MARRKKNPVPVFIPILIGIGGITGYYLYTKHKQKQAAEREAETLLNKIAPEVKEEGESALKQLETLAKERIEQLKKYI